MYEPHSGDIEQLQCGPIENDIVMRHLCFTDVVQVVLLDAAL